MTTLCTFRSPNHLGLFEVNELYHTITPEHKLFEVRYRYPTGGNGLPPPSEFLFADPEYEALIRRFLTWDPAAIKISG